MSNLQIGLAIAGGLVLAAVVVHSTWTSRKNAPRQAQPEDRSLDTQASLQEPSLLDSSFDPDRFPAPVVTRRPAMDSLIDVIATLALEGSSTTVSGETALAAMPATRRAGSKPFAIEGYNLASRVWEKPAPGQRYGGFQSGVQMANRSGALNEIEYSEFVVKTQAFADAIAATPEFPEMREQVARARELDLFASEHDAQLGFTIRARNAAWSPGYIQQNAARLGFVAGAIPGRMVLTAHAEGLPPVLMLAFDSQAALSEDPAQSAIRDVTLHLDVAQVDRAEQAFDRMCHAANALADAMDGVVTDDNGQVLPEQAMSTIGAAIQGLYDTLEQRDLAAGSPLARRLFS
jgi:hypothetical protein